MQANNKDQNKSNNFRNTKDKTGKTLEVKDELTGSIDQILRPTTWDDYVGQDIVKKILG